MVILDFNNFWSPSGGGVRRYHLERMKYYQKQKDTLLVFVMTDFKTYTEVVSDSVIIEHVKAFKMPLYDGYRFIWKKSQVRPVIQKYQPDVIEVGSPYILPKVVSKVAAQFCPQAKLVGFWHADFPVAYVERVFNHFLGKKIGRVMRNLAFAYARFQFKGYSAIQGSCHSVLSRMQEHHLQNLHWIPLGCDIEMFSPEKRDENLVQELKHGDENRCTIFFPHRFSKEKGIDLFLEAYPLLVEKLEVAPTVIFAGTGPYLYLVQAAVKKYEHVHFLGFLSSEEEMARYYASVEIGLALSGWETFGLSILEAMASGNALVGANTGAAAEHCRASNAGIILNERTSEGLANSIVRLSKENLSEKRKAARLYAQGYSWKSCFDRQLKLYSTITSSRNL